MNRSIVVLFFLATSALSVSGQHGGENILDHLPPYIKQLTHFGQRADWSHDGKRILFIEKTFGDIYEVEVATGEIRPMTHHFFHEGFVRALYLSNGDILLSGARNFDAGDPWKSRDARNAELWVLKRDLSGPPTALGVHCKEGPAVSRKNLKIAWALGATISYGEIEYVGEEQKPKLKVWKPLFISSDMPGTVKGWDLETQNFRLPDEKELIFNAFGGNFGFQAEVMGYNLETKEFINYTKSKETYDEPEGIFPDGSATLIESNRHRLNYKNMEKFMTLDIYKLQLEEDGKLERITYFNDNPHFKASNPVVSDDGKYIAFQYARTEDASGVGRGILVLDIEAWEKRKK